MTDLTKERLANIRLQIDEAFQHHDFFALCRAVERMSIVLTDLIESQPCRHRVSRKRLVFMSKKEAYKVLRYPALFSVWRRFPRKKDIDPNMGFPMLADFGLWGLWWIVRGYGGIVCKDGSEMPFHSADLYSGRVIGPRDLTAADGMKEQDGWRESLTNRINESLHV